ncbi:MAG: 1-deoxy-D-xylulose-5-phosphate synthase [Clostridia bacterium]|nr:1-deoxy-D-xylulose-5-phosphate synthase [Clostridia bacterium]
MYLEKINGPEDVKKLSVEQMEILADEMRDALMNKLSVCGGHCSSNLGIVELTIALHCVFSSPIDKIVFDVSHQSYSHKMLTGRNLSYLIPEEYDKVSGYTNPVESQHDIFNIGHTSTSLSLASGLVKARDLAGEQYNVIAVIGDGAIGGGEALEALSLASELKSNFIIVLNDNNMAISENCGGLYNNLEELRSSKGKSTFNMFKSFGLDYVYVHDGNNIQSLIETLNEVKDIGHPIVVHVSTKKGKGFKMAEDNSERWHARKPFDMTTGKDLVDRGVNYQMITYDYLLNKSKKDPRLAVVVSGTPSVLALNKDKREALGSHYVEVGVAEEHAVAMISGLAKNGARPVYAVYSSFVQRCYDQIAQDICINNSPATFLVFSASIYGNNDITHLGIFDIPMMSNIPNLVYMAPTCKEEYFAMLDWAISQEKYPVGIRVPCGQMILKEKDFSCDFSDVNKFEVVEKGKDVAIIGLGNFYAIAEKVSEILAKQGVNATLINPRFVTAIDEELLESLKAEHRLVVTIEDCVLNGGFGEKIARFYGDSDMKVKCYGYKKEFLDLFMPQEVLERNGITVENISNYILSKLK